MTPVIIRLPYRPPLDSAALFGFLAARAVPGVEHWDGTTYRRSLRLARGPAVVALTPGDAHVDCVLAATAADDVDDAIARCRRLLDLDTDPAPIDGALGRDALLAPLVARRPGLRTPGAVDADELAIRAVLGQQVSVASARNPRRAPRR